MTVALAMPPGVQLLDGSPPALADILTPAALELIVTLHREFNPRRQALLSQRQKRALALQAGEQPSYRKNTRPLAEATGPRLPLPPDLLCRQVEISGPVRASEIQAAVAAGADGFVADFEDATSPTWANLIAGQRVLRETVRGVLADPNTPTLHVRPRGWHLPERHLEINGEAISAALFDFGLALFHNAATLVARGSGAYFYLPKLENAQEADLWQRVFERASQLMGLAPGSIRATVLIEHVLAAFEMQEIVAALSPSISGLKTGSSDYYFSVIRSFGQRSLLPERSLLSPELPFMQAYRQRLVQICHHHGIHAIGSLAAWVPSSAQEQLPAAATTLLTTNLDAEIEAGFDGIWLAHPSLVPLARQRFAKVLNTHSHQHHVMPTGAISAAQLQNFLPSGPSSPPVTEQGVRQNLATSLRYLSAWLAGEGAPEIGNQRENAAAAECASAQLWQWRHQAVSLSDGKLLRAHMLRVWLSETQIQLATEGSGTAALHRARLILEDLIFAEHPPQFSLSAYAQLETL